MTLTDKELAETTPRVTVKEVEDVVLAAMSDAGNSYVAEMVTKALRVKFPHIFKE